MDRNKSMNMARRIFDMDIGEECEHEVNRCLDYVLTCEKCGEVRPMPLNLYTSKYKMRKAKRESPEPPSYIGDNPLFLPIELPQ